MNRTIASVLFLSIALAGCGGANAGAPTSAVPTSSARAIDGATYDVVLEFPGEAPVQDTLVFADGRFESTACTGFGFPKSGYSTRLDGDALAFQATAVKADGGSMEWHGTVRGDAVQGTAKRTLHGTVAAGTFHGSAHR